MGNLGSFPDKVCIVWAKLKNREEKIFDDRVLPEMSTSSDYGSHCIILLSLHIGGKDNPFSPLFLLFIEKVMVV